MCVCGIHLWYDEAVKEILSVPRRVLALLTLPAALSALSLASCASVEEVAPPPRTDTPPTLPPPESWEPPQINSFRPRVVEYDGDDSDSRQDYGARGGWGNLDEHLDSAGMAPSPMQGWIRN